jgi:hypothetical protein
VTAAANKPRMMNGVNQVTDVSQKLHWFGAET